MAAEPDSSEAPLEPQVDERDPWADNEAVRRYRLREDAKRPMSVNLAEGIALSEFLCGFAGILREK